MKQLTLTVALVLSGLSVTNAQTAGDKAEKNCVKEKMNDRNVLEKAVDKVVPGMEKAREGAAKRDCQLERVDAATKNKETDFEKKYEKEPKK